MCQGLCSTLLELILKPFFFSSRRHVLRKYIYTEQRQGRKGLTGG